MLAETGPADEVFAVGRILERLGELRELFSANEALDEGDFLRTGDLQSLPFLYDVKELGGFQRRLLPEKKNHQYFQNVIL